MKLVKKLLRLAYLVRKFLPISSSYFKLFVKINDFQNYFIFNCHKPSLPYVFNRQRFIPCKDTYYLIY